MNPSSVRVPVISGETKLVGLMGYPVEHSLSPKMHNAAFAVSDLQFIYIPFSVLPEDLGPAIRSLIPLGIVGVNLTIPHKERVLPFLDEISPEARAVGAVNTVVNRHGKLTGHNTDGVGFQNALIEFDYQVSGKHAIVLGAGGAARSIVHVLAAQCASVTVVNRSPERAQELVSSVQQVFPESVLNWLSLDDAVKLKEALIRSEVVINTTSVGMHPHVDVDAPVNPEVISSDSIVIDLIYNPVETKLLRESRIRGARTMNGLPMLVHQGAESFRIWTGCKPLISEMYSAVQPTSLASN